MTRPCTMVAAAGLILAVLGAAVDVLCESERADNGVRARRTLVYPSPTAIVQAIMGAGFPVDLQDESVLVGIVIKGHYILPKNASDYSNPNVYYARRKRRNANKEDPATITRWDVYRVLEQYAASYGFGGKECLLRTICELAEIPLDKSRGILEEILHVLFAPMATRDAVGEHRDYDYYAAQMMGKRAPGQCARFYGDCSKSYVDLFTL